MKKSFFIGLGTITLLVIAIMFLSFMLYEKYTNSSREKKIEVKHEVVNSTYLSNEEQGKIALEFEKQLYEKEKIASEAKIDVDREIKQIQSTLPDRFTVYTAMKRFDEVHEAVLAIKIPDGLSPENSKILFDARSNFAKAYETEAKAMYWLLDYVQNYNAKSMQYYSDCINETNALLLNAIPKVIDLQVKLGVDISKKDFYEQTKVITKDPFNKDNLNKGFFSDIEFGIGTDFTEVESKWGKRVADQHRERGAVGTYYQECRCSFFVGAEN